MTTGARLALVGLLVATAGAAADTPIDLSAPALASLALAKDTRATRLIGAEIYARDDDVGEISDVIVDLQKAEVRAVIVSVNGLFGSRRVAVPPAAVKIGADGHLAIDLPPDALKNAPEFQYAEKSTPD